MGAGGRFCFCALFISPGLLQAHLICLACSGGESIACPLALGGATLDEDGLAERVSFVGFFFKCESASN